MSALQPQNCTVPDPHMILEQSGDISNQLLHNPTVEHAQPIEGLLKVPQYLMMVNHSILPPQQTCRAP